MKYLEIASVAAFGVAAVVAFAGGRRERLRWSVLERDHSEFLAQGIIERGHLLSDLGDEEAIAKMARVVQETDQEWHRQHADDLRPDKFEILSAYLGNTRGRSLQV